MALPPTVARPGLRASKINAIRIGRGVDAYLFLVVLNRAESPFCPAHAAVPNSHPTPAVRAIASAPQNVTRIAPIVTPAPPARAANPPRNARNTSDVTEMRMIKLAGGAITVTRRGIAAPVAKETAEANAA